MLSIYRLPYAMPGEKIIKVLRRDLFILFKRVVVFLFLILLLVAFYYIMMIAFPDLLEGQMFYPLIILGASSYSLFIWLFFFFSFIDYYLDVWIITSERIIDIRQNGFFSRIISEQKLDKVQDVTSEVHGFFPTVLKYGDVHIQTAAEQGRFNFQEVPDPEGVRDVIIKLMNEKHISHNT